MVTATCWQCGVHLSNIITPVSRREECSQCHSDIHACTMCQHYDVHNRTGCNEERAEFIVDKERANFCEYYALSSRAFDDTKLIKQRQAKAQLAALFDDEECDSEHRDYHEQKRDDAVNVAQNHTQAPLQSPQSETPAQAAERKLRELLNQ
ncbi:hypothetical protein Patl_2878 [Paraglaciecola sp. T6c]|uniref:hypothetical protein n=1 Tax=Pseudoalteromonas atlantica (strain T6c / ATCC BAA-1087) TaxID=3042615 RepID=UPI00005C62A1|nr:hypothetical protein [Paraglaciecola sp. T6c]ABG41386.1 hypothetical protein Patl_2878 [Paraglaciecola sp. T6c]